MSIQNGASTTTKLNGGIVMKNVLKGFKVFNANGEVVFYENQNNLVTELDVICTTIKREGKLLKTYSLPSPVYRSYQKAIENGIEQVKFSFANKLTEWQATQMAKVQANEKYEIEKQKRHAQKPLSNAALSKVLYEPQNMLEFIKYEDVVSIEIITIDLTDRILIVADDKEGYPTSHSINYDTFKFLTEKEVKEQYDMVFFTDRTAFNARTKGQPVTRPTLKIVRDCGYGVAFKEIEVKDRHLLANGYADEDTLLNWLDTIHAGHLTKKQHTVYHVHINDIKSDDQGVLHYKGAAVINEHASSSYLLETLENNGYTPIVLNADPDDRFKPQFVKDTNVFKRKEIFENGFWMEINGEPKLCRRILQSSSQARTIKITFSDCPLEEFWNIRGQLSYGLIKEGDNLEPNKAEKRFGLTSSTSIKASKHYKAVILDDLVVNINQEGHELAYDEEKSLERNKVLFKIKKFDERRQSMPTDGQILLSHPIAAQLSRDIKLISNDEFMYWMLKTCTMVKVDITDENRSDYSFDFPYKVTDCKSFDVIREMIKTDSKLDDILKRIITGVQLRLNISDKGLGILFDVKKYWATIHNQIVKRYQEKGLPVPAIEFDPELILSMESSHKVKTKDVIYSVEVRICNYTNAINKKPEKHRLSTQAFFSLDLPREILKELADEELNVLKDAFNSLETAIAVTGCYGRNEINTRLNSILTLEPKLARKAFKNSNIQEKLYDFIEKQLLELQFGQLYVKAETHYITCDPLAMFEPEKALKGKVFKEVNGKKVLVQQSEAYFADQNGVRLNKETNSLVALIRHPHLNRTEKGLVKLVDCEELWYLRNILVINAYDDTFARMGGADVDGDKAMMIFDERVVKNTKFFNQFIQQGISTDEKRKAGLIKDKVSYCYDYEAIYSAHDAGTEGTQIAEATNTILRTTELFSALDVSPITDKDIKTFRKEIYASIVQLCCMSGQLIDQAGVPTEERLYMEHYASDFWGKYPYVTKTMVEYRMHKKGIRFDQIDPKHFDAFENCEVVDLDTSFRYIAQYVRKTMKDLSDKYLQVDYSKGYEKRTMRTADNRPLCSYVASHLLKCTETTLQALDEVKSIASYWAAAASQINLLPNKEDDDKDVINEAWDQLKSDIRGLLLSVHPDPRMCAALTFFYCYGTGMADRRTHSEGLVWFCMLEEFIEFLNPGYSCMYLKAPSQATENDEVVVVDGALFLRRFIEKDGQTEAYDFFIDRVGYKLASNKLTKLGKELYMIATRPRSVMFDKPSSLIAMRVRENADNRLLKLNTNYRLSFQQGKLFIFTMENALVGQVYTSKARFKDLNNKIIRVERLACGAWQLKDDKKPATITSSALISIIGENENPYVKLHEAFTQEAIVAGLKGHAIKDETEELTTVECLETEDVISVYEETEVEDLSEVELDFSDDLDAYIELDNYFQNEEQAERAETPQIVKASFTPKSTPTVEVEVEEDDFDLYDAMDGLFL